MRGGYANVYSGMIRPEGTQVAIKTARGGIPGDVNIIKSFLKEVHVWCKLDHKNILPLLGITTQFDLTVSIVSPWMEKGNAHDYVQDTMIDPRPLIEGIARGIYYLHHHKPYAVYHGDLKGLNVLISRDGCPLLADFGLSYLVNSSFSLSVSGHSGRTPCWSSPETLDGADPSAAGDMWSFAMTALELFTRKRPFHNLKATAIILRILKGAPDRPSDNETYSRMTDEWWEIFLPCWNIEATSRPHIPDVVDRIARIVRDFTIAVFVMD
ncbi:hypothetical protein ID866_7034 [Astraeus odoratus]|nr:hypothetical protein ID866_7034 [Astraeus odoratus]